MLAGFAVVAIFQIIGERIGDGLQKSALAWADRIGGIAMGAVLGLVVMIAVLVGMLFTPWPREAGRAAAEARTTLPLIAGARRLLVVDRFVPGLRTVHRTLNEASRKAGDSSRQS